MKKKTEAQCSGTMLTVGFHAANPPLIWRFDLERNHSFTIALQGEEGDWELGVTSPKGDFYSIAHFLAREDAEEAFAKVEKILSRQKRSIMKWALGLVGMLAALVIVAAVLFGFSVFHKASQISSLAQTGMMRQQPPAIVSGEPMSADDVLTPPQ